MVYTIYRVIMPNFSPFRWKMAELLTLRPFQFFSSEGRKVGRTEKWGIERRAVANNHLSSSIIEHHLLSAFTTEYNHLPLSTTAYHYQPSSITSYHHLSSPIIAYHHPPSPITTYHHLPSSTTAYHHPTHNHLSQNVTTYHHLPQNITNNQLSYSIIAYHHPPSSIIAYHHLSSSTTIGPFLITSMMLRTHQKKFQLNWLIHDWDNELRNLGAIQVYHMLSPKSGGGGGSQMFHYQLDSATLKTTHKKFQLNRSRNSWVMIYSVFAKKFQGRRELWREFGTQ